MSLALLLSHLLLAGVLIVAGIAKLADLHGSRQAMGDFGVPSLLVNDVKTGSGSLLVKLACLNGNFDEEWVFRYFGESARLIRNTLTYTDRVLVKSLFFVLRT